VFKENICWLGAAVSTVMPGVLVSGLVVSTTGVVYATTTVKIVTYNQGTLMTTSRNVLLIFLYCVATSFSGLLVGSNSTGYINGIGSNAKFNTLLGIAITTSNVIYVADSVNNVIRSILIGIVWIY
jgi:hypothetical protein